MQGFDELLVLRNGAPTLDLENFHHTPILPHSQSIKREIFRDSPDDMSFLRIWQRVKGID